MPDSEPAVKFENRVSGYGQGQVVRWALMFTEQGGGWGLRHQSEYHPSPQPRMSKGSGTKFAVKDPLQVSLPEKVPVMV